MPSEHALLEEFFGTKFEFDVKPRDNLGGVILFDGVVFWQIFFDKAAKHLHFSCNIEKDMGAFPIVEAGIFYSQLRVEELPGVGSVLMITAKGELRTIPPFAVTKTKDGRFSLCTSTGFQPEE